MSQIFDVVVVGAGVAGMMVVQTLARLAPSLRIGLVTLQTPAQAGATPWAQGGVAVAWGMDDRPDLHALDTIAAGAGLCQTEAVEILTEEGPQRIRDLLAMGANFDRQASGQLALAREAAHGRRRIVHAGDSSGREIARVLTNNIPANVVVISGRVTRLLTLGSRVVGVQLDGEHCLRAAHVVLATGGVGQLFAATTNPAGAEGQGLALAFNIGARLRDLEFVQFHPTALAVAGLHSHLPLLTEALRGQGARLVDESGKFFMSEFHPDAEMAPRDVVAFALWQYQQQGHKTFLDVRSMPIASQFPQVNVLCCQAGFKPDQDLLPVTPAAHYHMGGIEVDLWGRTCVPGLWACGEVASSGVHGANRLASNSLLEGLVFGYRLGLALSESEFSLPGYPVVATRVPSGKKPSVLTKLRHILWSGMGLARSLQGMQQALQALERVQRREANNCTDAVLVARLMLQAGLFRQESRGAHRRLDFPMTNPAWQGHSLSQLDQPVVLQAVDLSNSKENLSNAFCTAI